MYIQWLVIGDDTCMCLSIYLYIYIWIMLIDGSVHQRLLRLFSS